jgi:hypothetical protein
MYSSLLKVTSFYKDFLSDYYHSNPGITEKSYQEQFKHLMAEGYGYADFFPHYLEKNHSIETREIVHNAGHLQQTWAKEKACKLAGDDLLLEQIAYYKPEVVYIQDSINFDARFMDRIREKVKSVRLLIGHCCTPYTAANLEAFGSYDLMLTCSKKFQEELEKHQVKTYLFPHAAEASLLPEIVSPVPPENDIIFIASLLCRNEFHHTRIAYVEEILKSGLPLRMYGIIEEDPWHLLKMKQASYLLIRAIENAGIKGLRSMRTYRKMAQLKEMPVRSHYSAWIKKNIRREPLFGRHMLSEIARHSIGFNLHAEVSGDFAANVRMFEVTVAGALLVTDHKKNIRDLFEPDSEILTYSSTGECIEKLRWALDHPEEAAKIAAAGQKRTLSDHTVEKRAELLYDIMKKEFSRTQA